MAPCAPRLGAQGTERGSAPFYFLSSIISLLLIIDIDEFGVDDVVLAFVIRLGLTIGRRRLLRAGLAGALVHGIGAIAGVDSVLEFAVFGGMGLGVAGHLFNLILGETARTGDGDLLFVVG